MFLSIAELLEKQPGIADAIEAAKEAHGYGAIPRLCKYQIEMIEFLIELLNSGDYGTLVPNYDNALFKKSAAYFDDLSGVGPIYTSDRYDPISITLENPFGLHKVDKVTITISPNMVTLGRPYFIGVANSHSPYKDVKKLIDIIAHLKVNY